MGRESRAIISLAWTFGVVTTVAAIWATPMLGAQAKPGSSSGWTLGPDAETLKNPQTASEKVLAAGKAVFKDKCERCHGPGGLGDGPDADPDAPPEMDLTNAKRAARNPDGVVFYKVMNGRRKPKMPVFKEELSEEQVWAVVAYVQTLRRTK